MTTIQDEYKDTLNAWRGSSPKQQQRRLEVKEAGFWSDCAAQPYVPDGAGLISKKAAQQATAVRFPEYDPRSDPHLSSFYTRQEERAIQVLELKSHRVAAKKAERAASARSNRSTSPGAKNNAVNANARFRSSGKTQASLAKISKSKPVRMPKAPPGSTQAPALSQRQAQQSEKQFNRQQHQLQQQQQNQRHSRPTSARSTMSSASAANRHRQQQAANQTTSSSDSTMHLNFASQICPELQALDQFKKHQEHRDDVRERESHRRAIHELSLSHYSNASSMGGNSSTIAAGGGTTAALHSQATSSNTRSICMPVDSDHVLAVKRLFVRSAVPKNGNPCRSPICAIKNASENFYVILTREVDLPDIIYMGIAQSNRFRQVAGLHHMTAVPSPEVIFNWLVILGCTETVDWPSFLMLCSADLVNDFDKVSDVKTAYHQFTDKTPLDSGMAYQKVLLYLKSVASAKSPPRNGSGANSNNKQGFHANAFHDDDMPITSSNNNANSGFETEGGSRATSPNMMGRNNKSSFFQPGDFYGPRHTCSFAEALFCLMPYRIQFHLTKANARGFSTSKNFRGRVPHSGQVEDDQHHHGEPGRRTASASSRHSKRSHDDDTMSDSSSKRSHSASSSTKDETRTASKSERRKKRNKSKSKTLSSDDSAGEGDDSHHSKAIRFHKFKNAKSRFLEEQAAESRYERKVWL